MVRKFRNEGTRVGIERGREDQAWGPEKAREKVEGGRNSDRLDWQSFSRRRDFGVIRMRGLRKPTPL